MSASRESEKGRLPEGYTGAALELLGGAGARSGSRIRVKTNDGFEATGLLIPRYESAGSDNIVLKLKSGYNIGLEVGSISSISVLEEPIPPTVDAAGTVLGGAKPEKAVLLLSTGGTIASRVDYRTGAVRPAYTASDLYASIPELGTVADVRCEVVFSAFSENLYQPHWKVLSERIVTESARDKRFNGVVVMLGTDTMAYVSAALSFSLLGFDYPVVCVGAQRSSDRPSADSALNLKGAVRFAAYSNRRGVFVAMHEDESDDAVAIHSGVRVRKNHTSRRDAFHSIDVPHCAEVRGGKISFDAGYRSVESEMEEFRQKTNFDTKVSIVKFYPGFHPSMLDHLADAATRGIIVEGTGLGHVSSENVVKIAELVRKGIFVGITSQCIWGHVDLNVYETGIDLLDAGAVPLGNMLSETAYAKLSWALGNFPPERMKSIMTKNLAGELTDRIVLATGNRSG